MTSDETHHHGLTNENKTTDKAEESQPTEDSDGKVEASTSRPDLGARIFTTLGATKNPIKREDGFWEKLFRRF